MTKKSKDIVFTTALRTAIGRYKGMWNKYQAHDLGETVIKNILSKSEVEPKFIDEVIMGQVLTGDTGQNPARQAAIRAGIPKEKTGYVINQVCGSGLRSIVAGYQSILLGDAKIVIAGGQESMTNSKEEMIQGDILKDEHPREDTTIESLSKLKPAFKENGTVTAGNSSGVTDGAAAVILMTRDEADKRNLKPLAKIVSWATCGVDPALMGSGPIPASKKALEKAGWSINDLDLVESNEAFAAQSIAVIRELKIPIEKINVNGGAIALGHPIGASGTRIVVTLIHEMIKRDVKQSLATLCIGGGMGISMCIERD